MLICNNEVSIDIGGFGWWWWVEISDCFLREFAVGYSNSSLAPLFNTGLSLFGQVQVIGAK